MGLVTQLHGQSFMAAGPAAEQTEADGEQAQSRNLPCMRPKVRAAETPNPISLSMASK